jgi:hypothetical protein
MDGNRIMRRGLQKKLTETGIGDTEIEVSDIERKTDVIPGQE